MFADKLNWQLWADLSCGYDRSVLQSETSVDILGPKSRVWLGKLTRLHNVWSCRLPVASVGRSTAQAGSDYEVEI